ncbi:glycosyl transferase [Tistrella bauzanensis]|uniref:Glycosyl transferase n=1 Tax=Tistrella bauzanensis TaxID=657419 RepID=A0ABQ1IEA9_9PROT|nr:glycosyltransferase family 9 protein [Tistrella bauzanensis]GGB35105.1 glycosyl transferase [Tistrella bauzanensis]
MTMTSGPETPVAQPVLPALPGIDPAARVLVIKHSAFGDVILALGPMKAIRLAHPLGRVTLLTTKPYAGLLEASGLFDEIWIDDRPRLFQLGAIGRLRRRLNDAGFDRVYDLQTSDRSSRYYRLFRKPQPDWSGIAPGCSHPHANPGRDHMHTVERQAEQLAMAGIPRVPAPDLSFLRADLTSFDLPMRFALLVPGGAAHRPGKRWPPQQYAETARLLADQGIVPILLGTRAEADAIRAVTAAEPRAMSFEGRTSFAEIAALARRAAVAVGNDTGPMHLIAAVGCPSLSLFSAESDPVLTRPRGPRASWLRADRLADLPVSDVSKAIRRLLDL